MSNSEEERLPEAQSSLPSRLLTTKQTAEILSISRRRLLRLVKSGEIPADKFADEYGDPTDNRPGRYEFRFTEKDVDALRERILRPAKISDEAAELRRIYKIIDDS